MAINRIIYDVSGEELVDQNGQVTVYGIDGNGHKVNKVVYGQTVLMDITDTDATAADVATGKYFYTNDGIKRAGTKSSATPMNVNAGTVSVSNKNMSIDSTSANLGSKTITTNGTYDAEDDDLDGYSEVVVNVSGGSPDLGTKTVTANGTYTASTDSLDGYSSVTVNVPTYKTGTVSFSSTYNTTGNREIVSLATIGFTPKQFYLRIRDRSVVSGQQYAILRASFETLADNTYFRTTTRYSKTDNTLATTQNSTAWTTQTNYYLYTDGTSIYLRTTNTFILFTGTSYDWVAIP